MPEQLAVNADEQTVIEQPLPKPLRIRSARFVSNLLAPSTISIPLVFLVAFYHALSPMKALFYACVTLFFICVGPLAYIVIGVRLGTFSDMDVSRRSERLGPFVFGLGSVLLCLFALQILHGPKNLFTLLLIIVVSGVLMMIITLWWKISIHASSLASAATILTVLYGAIFLPTFLLVVLVSWSRVELRRHTVAQVVMGSLVSIALSLVILYIRGV